MIITRLKGGMGNQMFQYALGRALSLKYATSLGLDVSFYDPKFPSRRQYDLNIFNITGKILDKNEIPFKYRLFHNIKILEKLVKHKGKEKSFPFDPEVFSLKGNLYLDGYWQSPKYFAGFEEVIQKDFALKNPLRDNVKALAEEISNTKSLCIHVRRGDYVGNKAHEVITNEYYEKGIRYISGKTSIEKIYVFSDDVEWCKNNLKFEFPTMFVGNEYAGEKGEEHMFLMSQCKNFIIANSSFSWWAAWLSNYKEKIIVCPKQWFPDVSINTSDLIPSEWVKI